ncbi:UNVERIFIED_CONTAM: hypothetical protein Sangu_2118500 [Sesamum angustifolium]|uniref:Rad21/Rec8-like protein C-terminal eukaryotic domain-containing protein n=1 Tax=Sesamum angustifolium TaxID=2727405 RepID=A0AAW2LCG0_9LAMI
MNDIRVNLQLPTDALSTMKIATLMDLPSVVLVEKLVTSGNRQVHYPAALLEMWMRSTQPPHDSPSGRSSHPQPPEPSSSSPPERMHFMEPMGDPFEDFHSRIGSQSMGISIEKQRANAHDTEMPPEILMEEFRNNLKNNGLGEKEANGMSASKANLMTTPGNSGILLFDVLYLFSFLLPSEQIFSMYNAIGDEIRTVRLISATLADVQQERPLSASRNSGNGLEPVAEEPSWQHSDPNFKLARLSENGLSPDNVLATRDYIRVEQKAPYGDILISRGAKM